jgi:hypothetical protein
MGLVDLCFAKNTRVRKSYTTQTQAKKDENGRKAKKQKK